MRKSLIHKYCDEIVFVNFTIRNIRITQISRYIIISVSRKLFSFVWN